MRLDELRRLDKLLSEARSPADVFMALRDRSLQGDARRLALVGEHRRLESLANPERFMGNPPAQDLAREIVARLAELLRAAEELLAGPEQAVEPVVEPMVEPVEAPPRWRAADEVVAGFEVVAGANRYRLGEPLAVGDVATIFRGRCTAGPRSGAEVVGKLAIDRADNAFLLAETQALRLLRAHRVAPTRDLVDRRAHFKQPRALESAEVGA